MSHDPAQLGQEVIERCLGLGFAVAGIAPAAPTQRKRELLEWLGAGRHGDMKWMEEYLPERLDVGLLQPGARAVIMVADRYALRGATDPVRDVPLGRIARYARGRDYHKAIKRRLHSLADSLRARYPGNKFRSFVDTAPVLERELAAAAGLGWIGKHTLLIHPQQGSYLLLGGIATTLELAPPPMQRPTPDHCGSCTRCIDACPTGAITPYSVDARRCISYLTIEHPGPIEPELAERMGDWIAGCDVCQEVCPHNSARPDDGRPRGVQPAYQPRGEGFDLLHVLGMDERQRRFAFATSALKRISLAMLRRNAVIAAANRVRVRAMPAVEARLREIWEEPSEDPLVRRTAAAVLQRR